MAEAALPQSPGDDDDDAPDSTSVFKRQLLELVQQADIDNNRMMETKEFLDLLLTFVSNATEETRKSIKEILDSLDEQAQGVIFYPQFFKHENFDQFLQCIEQDIQNVDIASSAPPPSTSFAGRNSKSVNMFDEHNSKSKINIYADAYAFASQSQSQLQSQSSHEKRMILAQKEVIGKLRTWIATEGQPAKTKFESTQQQNEMLQIELQDLRLQFETVRSEVNTLHSEKQSLQVNYDELSKQKTEMADELAETSSTLLHSQTSLRAFESKQDEIQRLRTQLKAVQERCAGIERDYEIQCARNEQFEAEMQALQQTLLHRTNELEEMSAMKQECEQELAEKMEEIKALGLQLNDQNEEMADLKEKAKLNVHAPVDSVDQGFYDEHNKTLRRRQESDMGGLGQMGSITGLLGGAGNTFTFNNNGDARQLVTRVSGFMNDMNEDEMDDIARVQGTDTLEVYAGELNSLVLEYQQKEKTWTDERAQFVQKNKTCEDEIQALRTQLVAEQETLRKEQERRNALQEELHTAMTQLKREKAQAQIFEEEKVTHSDEQSPLIKKDRTLKFDVEELETKTCVLFGFTMW
eukprot:CAMPEP_0202690880 /NCGR_PEP_ID=MMETSP1385-20130828/5758_1 /ASSEMBLY_ACC=CAM_ASM_000861 /TAXON_ID=933848 /ORGANISM="Elphidium margaritaceum" /LENGTH=579 /DNA_ID=CAMNT_0049346205 /DNA_START=43 /DNA_END=1779 /DNA_ORIENTATION=+